jgi:hypothetical protein
MVNSSMQIVLVTLATLLSHVPYSFDTGLHSLTALSHTPWLSEPSKARNTLLPHTPPLCVAALG